MGYRLRHGEPLVSGLLAAASEAAAAAARRLDAAGDDPAKAAHEARKHGKASRAALRLLRGDLAAERVAAAAAALREGNRRLAAARDSQAMLDTLAALAGRRRVPRRDRAAAEAVLRRRRDAELAAVGEGELAAAAAAFRVASEALAAPATPGGASGVRGELARLFRRGRRRREQALGTGDSEAFHAWRRDAKDLWYAVRLFAPAWPGPLEALALELHLLARALGEEHDLAVLAAFLAGEEDGGRHTLPLARAIAREQAERRATAVALGARLWAEPPRGFAGRLVAYHAAWAWSRPVAER